MVSGAWVVGEQETQWLAWQHSFVDRRNLVWQWLDEGRVHGEHRVKQMCQADTMCF